MAVTVGDGQVTVNPVLTVTYNSLRTQMKFYRYATKNAVGDGGDGQNIGHSKERSTHIASNK